MSAGQGGPAPTATGTGARSRRASGGIRRRGAAAALATATALLPCVPLAAPAHAVETRGDPSGKATPKPPASMSTLGGERLGRPGTQVDPLAPALPKGLSGRSWLVADAESGQVLAAHNAHWQLPPASTLKMLFADTVLPKFPKTQTHKVLPSDLEGMGEGSSLVGIKEDLTYSVHDLWLGVFLRSGNDAVHVLSAMNGGVEKTVSDMQAQAEKLNALDTHVVTPDGYDEKGQVSSAYDLTLFARSGLQNPDFRAYCSTASAEFPGEMKKGKKGKKTRESFGIQNTNRLLTGVYDGKPYQGIAGVKNGYTTKAGNTFTGMAQHGDRVLLVTVMNPQTEHSDEVYKESADLFDWGFRAAGSAKPVGTLVTPGPRGADAAKHTGDSDPKKPGDQGGKPSAAAASQQDGSDGIWPALGITVGSLLVLGAIAFAVHRRWPLPDLVRRRPRG